MPSQKDFLVDYSSQNTYKIYFPKTSKIKHLRDIIFIKNDKSLETSLAENRDLFYYSKLNSKNTLITTNENVSQFIKPLTSKAI